MPGDVNRDGVVDEGDYVAWSDAFGVSGPITADENGDGVVDYQLIREALAAATPPAGVPEPTAALPTLAMGAFAGRRRRG